MSIWKLTTLGIAILLLTFAGSISPGAVSAQQTSACATGGAVPDRGQQSRSGVRLRRAAGSP